ncbi:hypothetical protein KQH27_00835 [bacterium]|nr:hypothetical protein [bacterium]
MTDINKQLDEIIQKLDVVVKLIAIETLSNFKTNKDKIMFLLNLGFTSSQIISITDIPSKTVYNVISSTSKDENKVKEGKEK